jgi:phosphohistidine phosphatase SixA
MAEMRPSTSSRLSYFALLILLTAVFVLGYFYFLRPVTTVILVRHAEKNIEPSNPDPALSPAGELRARELAHMFGDSGVTAIYATQYQRTQQTVQPLADRVSLPITKVDSGNPNEVARQIKSIHRGGLVFVAGHNNTVPAIIAALGGGNYPVIPESEYDNMFVVTLYRLGKAKVLKMRYGSSEAVTGNQQMMVKP